MTNYKVTLKNGENYFFNGVHFVKDKPMVVNGDDTAFVRLPGVETQTEMPVIEYLKTITDYLNVEQTGERLGRKKFLVELDDGNTVVEDKSSSDDEFKNVPVLGAEDDVVDPALLKDAPNEKPKGILP